MHFVWIFLSTTPDLNRKLLRAIHKCQIPIRKIIFHGMPLWSEITPALQLVSNHFSIGWSKEYKSPWGTLSLRHNSWATLHLRNKWSTDSSPRWHIVHIGLRFKPLEPRTSPMGKLLCEHSQMKNWTRGCVSAFQIHAMEGVSRFKGFKPLVNR